MQRDGTKFLYVNPLEVIPGLSGEQKEYAHVLDKYGLLYHIDDDAKEVFSDKKIAHILNRNSAHFSKYAHARS